MCVIQGECACLSMCAWDKELTFMVSVHACRYVCMTQSGECACVSFRVSVRACQGACVTRSGRSR